jgi:hypothetical protein
MTNQSMRATFGRKFITSTGLEHPEQLRTPRGSNMLETLISPDCRVARTYGTCEEDLAPAFERTIFNLDPFQG